MKEFCSDSVASFLVILNIQWAIPQCWDVNDVTDVNDRHFLCIWTPPCRLVFLQTSINIILVDNIELFYGQFDSTWRTQSTTATVKNWNPTESVHFVESNQRNKDSHGLNCQSEIFTIVDLIGGIGCYLIEHFHELHVQLMTVVGPLEL